jgi:hypothetical protein
VAFCSIKYHEAIAAKKVTMNFVIKVTEGENGECQVNNLKIITCHKYNE